MATKHIDIPKIFLDIPNIKFRILKKFSKAPIAVKKHNTDNLAKSSYTILDLSANDARLKKYLTDGYGYGIVFNKETGIIGIDYDIEEVQNEAELILPKTFTVESACHKTHHAYYKTNKFINDGFNDNNKGEILSIRADNMYVVGPNCLVKDAKDNFKIKKYNIVNNISIAFIDYDELLSVLKPLVNKYNSANKKTSLPKDNNISDNIPKVLPEKLNFEKSDKKINFQDIISDPKNIKLSSVLKHYGFDVSRNPTECLFHKSEGKQSFGWVDELTDDERKKNVELLSSGKKLKSDNSYHCFSVGCKSSGNILTIVRKMENCNTLTAYNFIAKTFNLQKEKELCDEAYRLESVSNKILKEMDDSEYPEIKKEYLKLLYAKKIQDFKYATELLAEFCILKLHIKTLKTAKKEKYSYVSDKSDARVGLYVPEGQNEIQELLNKILKSHSSPFIDKLVINKIEGKTMINEDIFLKESLKNEDEIIIKNGIYSLKDFKLMPFNHNKIFLRKINAKFVPGAKCPMIKNFIEEIAEPKYVNLMWEIIGYCFLKENKFEKLFMFLGAGGNGKGKFIELITYLFGGFPNVTALGLADFEATSFQLHQLSGAFINVAADIGEKPLVETEMLKQASGRDEMSTRRKNRESITFKNFAKIMFACNKLPMIPPAQGTPGFWRRWIFLKFKTRFVAKNVYDVEKKLDPNSKIIVMDTDIMSKIKNNESEMNGLFNEAIKGLQRLLKNNCFSYSLSNNEVKLMWDRESNSFQAFAEDKLEFGGITNCKTTFIINESLITQYSKYCRTLGISMLERTKMEVQLAENGASKGQKLIYNVNDENYYKPRVWNGVIFKDNTLNYAKRNLSRIDFDKKKVETTSVKQFTDFLKVDSKKESKKNE